MVRDFDDNEFPLAYLISFRTYGTWLHGDPRGSVDRRTHNKYGTPKIPPKLRLINAERSQLKHPPVKLDAYQDRQLRSQFVKYANIVAIGYSR